jgi:hypothetical protein
MVGVKVTESEKGSIPGIHWFWVQLIKGSFHRNNFTWLYAISYRILLYLAFDDLKLIIHNMRIIYFLPLLLLQSCSNDDLCGEETRTEIAFENYNEFLDLKNYSEDDATFSSYSVYQPLDSMSGDSSISWTMQTELRNICTSDVPKIDFFALLRKRDSLVSVIGGVQEDTNQVEYLPIEASPNGLYFNKAIDYHLKNMQSGSTTLFVTLTIRYPSKGSFTEDKDYFFSILDVMDSRVIAHKPK